MKCIKPFDEVAHRQMANLCLVECPVNSSITNQAQGAELEINYIVRKYGISTDMKPGAVLQAVREGLVPGKVGVFGDTGELSYADLMMRLKKAELVFMDLPAGVRSEFGNQPAQLLEELRKAEKGDDAAVQRLVAAKVYEAPPVKAAVPALAEAAPAADKAAVGGKSPGAGVVAPAAS